MARYVNLKNALEFNKISVGLAAAGAAYASSLGREYPQAWVKLILTADCIGFAIAFVLGLMVFGRASLIADSAPHDESLATLGRQHLWALGLSLIPVVGAALWRIWG